MSLIQIIKRVLLEININEQIFSKKSLCRKEVMNSVESWKTFPISSYEDILLMF